MGNHHKLLNFLRPDPAVAACSPRSFSSSSASVSDDDGYRCSSYPTSPSRYGGSSTPPTPKSPWAHLPGLAAGGEPGATGLIASLVKEDGHVYSLAATGDFLYTGTDSRNVRVWRHQRELAGFRTASGLVKAIVVADDGRIFTGHQDGKVRVWRAEADNPAVHRQVGSLPKLKDYLKSAVNPTSYVETQRKGRRRAVWLRHSDAVSSLSLDEGAGLLYSASWDRTFKVWRVSDSKCLESVGAHDDAVNTVAAAGFDSVVFTGSADGTVKAWRRKEGGATRHVLEKVLRKGEGAVTAIAVSPEDRVVYAGSSDGLVTYWYWVDGEARYGGVLKGHKMAVMCLAVAGDVVVSGSADRTLCVWRHHHQGEIKAAEMDTSGQLDHSPAALGSTPLPSPSPAPFVFYEDDYRYCYDDDSCLQDEDQDGDDDAATGLLAARLRELVRQKLAEVNASSVLAQTRSRRRVLSDDDVERQRTVAQCKAS